MIADHWTSDHWTYTVLFSSVVLVAYSVLLTHDIISEMVHPGSSLKGAALIYSASGNLSKMESAYSALHKSGNVDQTLLQQMLVAVIDGRRSNAAASLINLGAQIDDDMNWTGFRSPSVGIYKVLLPLDLFGIHSNPHFLDDLLDASVSIGRWSPPNQPALEPEGFRVAEFLLAQGAKPVPHGTEVWGNCGTLNDAACFQSVEYMELLLKTGASLRDTGALHRAALAGRLDMINFLIDCGADINEQIHWDMLGDVREPCTVYGRPLNYAIAYGKVEVVKALLERGADPTLETPGGQSALEVIPVRDEPAVAAEISQLLKASLGKD
jgi:hypothetical protein